MKLRVYDVNGSTLVSFIFNDLLELIEDRKWHSDREFALTPSNLVMGLNGDRRPHLLFSLRFAIVELLHYQEATYEIINQVAHKFRQHFSVSAESTHVR